MREFSSLLLPPLYIIPLSWTGSLGGQHKKKHPKGMMPKLTKEGLIVNMYLMKIHFLILKLFIIKEFSAWMMKVFR